MDVSRVSVACVSGKCRPSRAAPCHVSEACNSKGAGFTTCAGRLVWPASLVMEMELVLDASMASGFTTCRGRGECYALRCAMHLSFSARPKITSSKGTTASAAG